MTKQVEFTATLRDGKVEWHDHDGNPAKDHRVEIAAGHPQHSIVFTIIDKTCQGLAFDQSDPLHAWEQEGCPPPGINTDQLKTLHASPQKIEVLNRNSGPERTVHYQLNVSSADGTRCPCDPIIRNGGGGTGG